MKKLTLFSIAFLMAIMTAVGLSYDTYAANDSENVVSKGLYVIAKQNSMAICGVSGNDIAFSPESFERAMNAERIDYIKINSVPDEALGSLYLGSEGVGKGSVISRENLYKLSYVPKGEGISENFFTFETGKGYEIDCTVYVLKTLNCAPVAKSESELYTNVSTHRNVTLYGTMSGSDTEGDGLIFEVVSYPQNGLIRITDRENGEFCYTPAEDFVGEDSFKYVVRDVYGNYSSAQKINIKVNKSKMQSVLSDMGGHYAHSSAITMVENGIMSAKENEGKLVFAPDENVTREDFLVMAMKSAGINADFESADIGKTKFADDEKISINAKPYVLLAEKKGIIKGILQGDKSYFNPKQIVNASEAAVIVDNIIDSKSYLSASATVETIFADHMEIPEFAESSIRNLNYIGVFADNDGYVHPSKKLTKADASLILEKIIILTNK